MPDLTLIIGNKNYSSWSLRPWVFMKQNQIPFDEKRVALFTHTTNTELSQYNSDFKVPVLKDGDLIIWDSLSILEYLSETYLNSNGWPRNVQTRALARSMSAEMHSGFFNLRNELPMNCRKKFHDIHLTSAAKNEITRVTDLWRKYRSEFGADGEWLFGNYSIADAMFAPVALRFYGYNIPLGTIETAYVESVLNQPCIIEWIEAAKLEKEIIEDDEIKI